MIRSFEIENFKCIEHRRIDDCKLINVIVGDNGAGKTSLLEAIFLALASSSEVAQRYRQQRGVDGYFAGQIK
ncbi:MAG: AAA family ATPase [Methylobacterium sp.]|nr:AAA family ATPase [Methylobacterium sp.]